jgi:hypothetical protein
MAILLVTDEMHMVFAGSLIPARRLWWGRKLPELDLRIRKWTIPKSDCVAWPTSDFYVDQYVFVTNEGNTLYPKWVALDRCNDESWDENTYWISECMAAAQAITLEERRYMRLGYRQEERTMRWRWRRGYYE